MTRMNKSDGTGTIESTSNVWPDGVRCAVTFSFDVDGETLWLSRNPENRYRPGNLAQGAYGPKIAMHKILALFEKHRVKSTFFIPGWIIEKYPRMAQEVLARGHEVGYHGYLHEFDIDAGYEKEKEIMDRTLHIFESILKTRPVGFRSPLYEFTESTLPLMKSYQFLYSSMMMDDDLMRYG